jgi:urease accessory protein
MNMLKINTIVKDTDTYKYKEHKITYYLILDHEERRKTRQRVTLSDGTMASLILPRGSILLDGDLLEGNNKEIIKVVAESEDLMEAKADNINSYAKALYHMGNRHAPVEISVSSLIIRCKPCSILKSLLESLGLYVRELKAPFEPLKGSFLSNAHTHYHEKINEHFHDLTKDQSQKSHT